MRAHLGILAIAVAALTACSSTPSASSIEPSPPGARFDTAAALLDALRAKGLPCEGYRSIKIEQYDERALQSAYCKTSDGFELNASVYANREDASSSQQRLFDKPAQSFYGSYGVVGDNWAVAVSMEGKHWLARVQEAVGGRIVEIPPEK